MTSGETIRCPSCDAPEVVSTGISREYSAVFLTCRECKWDGVVLFTRDAEV